MPAELVIIGYPATRAVPVHGPAAASEAITTDTAEARHFRMEPADTAPRRSNRDTARRAASLDAVLLACILAGWASPERPLTRADALELAAHTLGTTGDSVIRAWADRVDPAERAVRWRRAMRCIHRSFATLIASQRPARRPTAVGHLRCPAALVTALPAVFPRCRRARRRRHTGQARSVTAWSVTAAAAPTVVTCSPPAPRTFARCRGRAGSGATRRALRACIHTGDALATAAAHQAATLHARWRTACWHLRRAQPSTITRDGAVSARALSAQARGEADVRELIRSTTNAAGSQARTERTPMAGRRARRCRAVARAAQSCPALAGAPHLARRRPAEHRSAGTRSRLSSVTTLRHPAFCRGAIYSAGASCL
ncbi:hypothetical protein JOM49_005254 [Amycolatopsis magusensis]|uniref:Uncharacterized protein n=1 Tax=Amycolatopsis magusensis TaxID=882444 RepID=A0ABS4PXZ9_9PSEU|nr:hypothetical protein [Amycolatopsis magusensis]